ncbi:MAG: TlpA disulfide reductase family protein [Isosphaeraceae bacterium]
MHLDPDQTPQDDAHEPASERTPEASRRVDRVSLLLTVATLAFVAGAIWLRLRTPELPEPPSLGSTPPPLRLLDPETSEPVFLLGLKGKVTWLVFWSADSASGKAVLPRLEEAWRTLRPHRRFALVAAAVDAGDPGKVRDVLGALHPRLPAYLATPETRLRYGVSQADPPLHLLIDAEGKVAALVRGAGKETVHRLAERIRGWLEDLDPLGPTRFARVLPAHPAAASAARIGASPSCESATMHFELTMNRSPHR